MRIVNFTRPEKKVECGAFFQWIEVCRFDLELCTLDATLIWQGWSVRAHKKGKNLRLQGPLMDARTSGRTGPAILFAGHSGELIPTLVRQLLKDHYQIEVPPPTERPVNAPKIDQNEKGESKPKVWRVKPKNKPLNQNAHLKNPPAQTRSVGGAFNK